MESKVFYTVFKEVDASQLTQAYPLTYNDAYCEPVEGIRKNDDGSIIGYTVIAWDKSKATAENLREILSHDCEPFNDANEYIAWRDKNLIEYDEEGNLITETNILQTLLGWLAK